MLEREMQELLWRYPDELLGERLKQFEWEISSGVGRADLVFEDRHGRLLVIEVKRGKLPRGAIDQLLDYFGMMKQKFPTKPVELMVVANSIPPERQLACESRDIECRAISEKRFRDVAAQFDYAFASEVTMPSGPPHPVVPAPRRRDTADSVGIGGSSGWTFRGTVRSSDEEQDFLSRCDAEGREFFTELLNAQKAASSRTRVTWKHESGFSLQFYFHRIGFASILWGFPSKNRDGRSTRQRLDLPFDFSLKAGVPEEFVNDLATSLSSLVPLSGGGKRPSIAIAALRSSDMAQIIQTIFSFVERASRK
jgi:hypothetical protein